MPRDLYEWLSRIKRVENEHAALHFAVRRVQDQFHADSTLFPTELRKDFQIAADHLEGTYITRLFTEFETALREYWAFTRNRQPPSRKRDLLDGIAAYRSIGNQELKDAHAVRDYRNKLLHDRLEETKPVSIANSRGSLCRFLSRLPPKW